jgi:putative autoinducer-2 (AI-2) aldolase
MDWGMKNRLSKLIQPDGHCFFLPIDHGYFQGPTSCLEKPGETIKPLLPYCDALFVTRGVLRACIDPANTKPIILRVSGGTSMAGKDLAHEALTTSVREVIRLNVSAVGLSVFVGSDYEYDSLVNLGKLVDEGQKFGIPVMAVTAVGKELEKRDARYLSLCCRIAAEFGATIVKTYWCENFDRVVNGCPVPVVMAGGLLIGGLAVPAVAGFLGRNAQRRTAGARWRRAARLAACSC